MTDSGGKGFQLPTLWLLNNNLYPLSQSPLEAKVESCSELLAPFKFEYIMWNILKKKNNQVEKICRDFVFDTNEQMISNNDIYF